MVIAVGPGITGRQVGDGVMYGGAPVEAYAEEQILRAKRVVRVPSYKDPVVAVSAILKGMIAQFLLYCYLKVKFR